MRRKNILFILLFLGLILCLSLIIAENSKQGITITESKITPIFSKPQNPESKKEEPNELEKAFVIFYTSDQKGYIQDCGCKKNSPGGLPRKKTLLDQIKKHNKDFILLDCGDFVSNPDERGKLKTKYFLKGMALLEYDAINLSHIDFIYGYDFIEDMMKQANLNFISANIVSKKDNKPLFPTHKIVELREQMGDRKIKVGVIGVTKSLSAMPRINKKLSDEEDIFTLTDPVEAANGVIQKIKDECDYIIVMAQISMKGAQNFAKQVKDVDLIIVGQEHTFNANPQDLFGTKVVSIGYRGNSMGEIRFTLDENKNVTQIAGKHHIISAPIEEDLDMLKVIAEYKKASLKIEAEYIRKVYKDMYVGDRGCKLCHPKEYEHWKSTQHSKAFKTLMNKNSQADPDCIACHTTGYNQYNGFRSFKKTPGMINVQCEACHGPLSLHAREQQLIKAKQLDKETASFRTITPELCIKCHDKDNDADFNFERDVLLVNHKNFKSEQTSVSSPKNTSTQNPNSESH